MGIPTGLTATPGTDLITLSWNAFYNDDFDDLDKWSVSTGGVGESVTIVNGAARLYVPSNQDNAEIVMRYSYLVPSIDFIATLDVSNYTPDNTTYGIPVHFRIVDPNNEDDTFITVYFRQNGTAQWGVHGQYNILGGGVTTITGGNVNQIPTILKIVRSGTVLEVHYYNGSWTKIGEKDFEDNSNDITKPVILTNDVESKGGWFDVDNMDFDIGADTYNLYWSTSPDVTPENGEPITGITDTSYEHAPLIAGQLYYYVITGVTDGIESEESDEVSEMTYSSSIIRLDDGDSNIVGAFVNSQTEKDIDYDHYQRSCNKTLKAYNIARKRRHILEFVNLPSDKASALSTLYGLNTEINFYRQYAEGESAITVRWVGNFNLYTPTKKSKSFLDAMYEGSITLEEVD